MNLGSFRRNSVVAVALGGGIGASVRYELLEHFGAATPPAFPRMTLVINLAGSFLLGLLLALVLEHWPPTRYVRPFVGIGILGGFTTFSTFAVETVRLTNANMTGAAAAYVIISLGGGMLAVFAGAIVANIWPRLPHRRDEEAE